MEPFGPYFDHNLFWNIAIFLILSTLALQTSLHSHHEMSFKSLVKANHLVPILAVSSFVAGVVSGILTVAQGTMQGAGVGVADVLPTFLLASLGTLWAYHCGLAELRKKRKIEAASDQ